MDVVLDGDSIIRPAGPAKEAAERALPPTALPRGFSFARRSPSWGEGQSLRLHGLFEVWPLFEDL